MKELLIYLVSNLVDNRDAIDVKETRTDTEVNLELTVDSSDMGKVIGRQGRIAKALRTIMRSVGNRDNLKVNVEIIG